MTDNGAKRVPMSGDAARMSACATALCRLLYGSRDLLQGARAVRIQTLDCRQVRGEELRRYDVGDRSVEVARALGRDAMDGKLD